VLNFLNLQKTLVHCRHGISRSGAVAVAVAMQLHQIDYAAALSLVRRARPSICPNSGFRLQLELWHRMNFKLQEADLRYNLFKLEHGLSSEPPSEASADSTLPTASGDLLVWGRSRSREGFRCAKCRAVLFYTAHVVPHSRERPVVWCDDDSELEYHDYRPSCGKGWFVLPLPWMGKGVRRLHCAKCAGKLGSCSLEGGVEEGGLSCPCGARAARGVWINSKKVDKFVLPGNNV
jgi:hypothetical protein